MITLLAYIGLIYGFLGDLLIFDESFVAIELVGMAIILILNITLICRKIEPAKSDKNSSSN